MTPSQMQNRLAHIALTRFGLGAKQGAIGRIRAGAKAAIKAELDTPGIALIKTPGLPTYYQACQAVHRDFTTEWDIKEKELTARIAKHMEPEVGFVERLVLFFSNHFSMSINKDTAILATIGQLERDVIRKHVLGSFENMLVEVIHHPAMIKYLDNDDSIGPNSPIGKSWGVGLNHNLAREICELHTLGVGGGYSEDDIDALAAMLTGWSFVRGWEADQGYNGGTPAKRGQFIFRPDWHEPGSHKLLGRTYAPNGEYQAIAALRALARHPSTAQYLAFKLVKHFITDDPTPEMVNPLATAYRASGGNIKAVALAMLDLPQAWSAPMKKLRTPYELQIAQMRALQRVYPQPDRWPFTETLRALRNLPWEHGTPDGFPDETFYWSGPDAMRVRMETAQMNAWTLQEIRGYIAHPTIIANNLFASVISDLSRQAVAQTTSLHDGLTMIFAIPEFQRR